MTKDIVISFDTTGSMYPCLTQVRRVVQETVRTLFDNIDDLRIGIIAHGDYCDDRDKIKVLNLTKDIDKICKFIKIAPQTGGGDADECYELVLNTVRSMNWSGGKSKALILIGDCNPHLPGYRYRDFTNKLDWENEAELLVEAGINIYPIKALHNSEGHFYRELARISSTPLLKLPQFSDIVDILCAVTYKQNGQLSEFEEQLKMRKKKPSYHVQRTLDLLAGRELSKRSVTIGSRFQVLDVDSDCSIKEFVEDNGLMFEKGRGFYQFTKSVLVQEYKEIVAQNKETGAILNGKRARKALNIPEGRHTVKPDKDSKYIGFVQSTSYNRKLLGGTKFLYEAKEC